MCDFGGGGGGGGGAEPLQCPVPVKAGDHSHGAVALVAEAGSSEVMKLLECSSDSLEQDGRKGPAVTPAAPCVAASLFYWDTVPIHKSYIGHEILVSAAAAAASLLQGVVRGKQRGRLGSLS